MSVFVTELVASVGSANGKVGGATAIGSAVVSIGGAATAYATNDFVHVDDKRIGQIPALVLAEEGCFSIVITKRSRDEILVTVSKPGCT
jgi:hypothetical protein